MVADSYALASMKLLQMDLNVSVQSNKEVELQASLKDITLYDEQPEQQNKKTGSVEPLQSRHPLDRRGVRVESAQI